MDPIRVAQRRPMTIGARAGARSILLASALVLAGCGASGSPSQSPAASLGEATLSAPAATPTSTTTATQAPPLPTISPSSAPRPAQLKLVHTGFHKGGVFSYVVYAEYQNVGGSAGYVYETSRIPGYIDTIVSDKLFDADGFTVGTNLFTGAFPQIVEPGAFLYLFDGNSVSNGIPVKVVMDNAPDFRDLGSEDLTLTVSAVKISGGIVSCVVQNNTGRSMEGGVVQLVGFDAKGLPVDGADLDIFTIPVTFDPGEKVRISDPNDLTFEDAIRSYKVFATASFINAAP